MLLEQKILRGLVNVNMPCIICQLHGVMATIILLINWVVFWGAHLVPNGDMIGLYMIDLMLDPDIACVFTLLSLLGL